MQGSFYLLFMKEKNNNRVIPTTPVLHLKLSGTQSVHDWLAVDRSAATAVQVQNLANKGVGTLDVHGHARRVVDGLSDRCRIRRFGTIAENS